MLVELAVENYAVAEAVRVRFHPGFNVLTGETGSGKSLVVDALGLLFGNRATPDVIRTGAPAARITGIFDIGEVKSGTRDAVGLRRILEDAGIEVEEGELILVREIFPEGKSRAYAGRRNVTVSLLRELAPFLGDIHGQHEQQRLFEPAAQREMLDAFAGNEALLERTENLFTELRAATTELAELDASEQEKLRMADLWAFQKREIEDAGLIPGEEEQLESERNILRNVARLQETASAALQTLYESEVSAAALLRTGLRYLEQLARTDPSRQELADSIRSAEITVAEAGRALASYLDSLESDPARMDQVEARLALIDKLKRKYGSSVDAVLRYMEEIQHNLEVLETSGERRNRLQARIGKLRDSFRETAAQLSQKRSEAARRLEKRVEEELAALAMGGASFRISIAPTDWSAEGADAVRFLLAANAGEELRPLDRVASGGELSRVALALKSAITSSGRKRSRCEPPRTLVFDEVDAGIGGGTADSVGRRLRALAAENQVICITHQPQIASLGMHHYRVEKYERDGRTVSVVEELDPQARVEEIGRMISGRKLTPEALKHAEQLLKTAAG